MMLEQQQRQELSLWSMLSDSQVPHNDNGQRRRSNTICGSCQGNMAKVFQVYANSTTDLKPQIAVDFQ